jgi:hypothetical protein
MDKLAANLGNCVFLMTMDCAARGCDQPCKREKLKGDKSDSTKKPDERLCDGSRRLALREMPHPLKDHALVATREESLFTL